MQVFDLVSVIPVAELRVVEVYQVLLNGYGGQTVFEWGIDSTLRLYRAWQVIRWSIFCRRPWLRACAKRAAKIESAVARNQARTDWTSNALA